MRRYQTTMLLAIITMLAMVFLASSVGATPPDWMMRQGSIGWALTQSDNTFVSVDCVVIDKIKAKQQPGYFVIRECFNYKDRVVVLTQPNQVLRLGMNVDVSGTLITLPNGCRAIVSPTVLGYTDEEGVLLTRGGPFTKGLLQPAPWEWKVDLTVNENTGTMSSMSTPQTISPNADEPNATPAEGASYYATVAEILETQSSAQTSTTRGMRTQSLYDGIPEILGLPDGSLVELECKGITAVGTQNIGGIDYNYFDMIENPPATDTIRCYYTGTAAVTDRVNRITGQIRHTDPQTPVIDIDTGPDYDYQILEGSCQLAAQGTIAWAKTFPDGTQLPAQLQAKVVSGSFGDLNYGHFFIQEPSRASGIRVNPTDYYWYTETGYPVTITSAQVTTINNQRALVVSSEDIENDWENWTAVNPLGMNNKWVAGGPFNVYTPGATDAFGLNNVGLLIKTWGLASNVQTGYFYINDGSDNVGVKVDVDQGGYQIYHNVQSGDYAAVTGIAQLETVNDQKMRVIKPRDYYDIQVIATAPQFTSITVTPNKAGVDEIVSISFYVSQTLAENPTVTVNGHSAAYYSGGYNYYTYRYTVSADDPSGWATIAISGRASGGLSGSATKSDALWVNDFSYNSRGSRRSMRDARGVTYYDYDVLGRLVKTTYPNGKWIAYEYDLNSNRTRMTVHLDAQTEHVTQYSYNDRSLLWKVTDQLGGITEYTYYANGLVDEIRYPNGTKVKHTYNSRNWSTDVVNKKSDGTTIAAFHYEYAYDPDNGKWGKNGTRSAVVEDIITPAGTSPARIQARVDYVYDVLYRLVDEHRYGDGGDPGVAYDKQYVYDAAGNRVRLISGAVQTDYTYDSANKMLTAGSATFTYDDAGNTLTKTDGSTVTTYTWDYRNTMTHWASTGQQSIEFTYDGNRSRVGRVRNGVTSEFLLDGREIGEEISGTDIVSYIGPRLIGSLQDTDRSLSHPDGVGSTRITTNGSETIESAMIYDAFGNLLWCQSPNGNPTLGYAGQFRYYTDQTGLQYLKARHYDPAVGRFVSRDPIGYKGGLNLYGYVGNRPINRVDPTGTKCRNAFNSPDVQICLMKLSICMANDPIKDAIDLVRDGKVRIKICDDPANDLGDDTDGDYGWRPWPISDLIRLGEGFDCSTLLHEISHYQDGWGYTPDEEKAYDYGINKYSDNCCDKIQIGDFPPPGPITTCGS